MSKPDPQARRLVLFLSRDPDLCARLGPALEETGLKLVPVAAADELANRLATAARDPGGDETVLSLLDTGALAGPEEIGELARACARATDPPLPLACLVTTPDIRYRLEALRAGVASSLTELADMAHVAARLAALVRHNPDAPERVLVVDDQPVAALFAARVLERAGIVAERVCDPLAVIEAVERFLPDLVLMDLHMPGASGVELTRLIREHERFADLPIVFLSNELDPGRQMDALRLGGNDFLAKPVPPELLVERVRGRLAQSRRACRDRNDPAPDPVTGLASRERLLARLDRLIGTGSIERSALLYIEIRGGEPELVKLAGALGSLLHPTDLAARAGEQALAVLARRADRDTLAAQADSLGKALRLGFHAGTDRDRRTPLGIGWCPLSASGQDAVTLVSRARKAAYRSLSRGDGQVECYLNSGGGKADKGGSEGSTASRARAAIEAGHLTLLFEPMVALRGTPSLRYEATPRLHLPDGEILPPASFLRPAARAGLAECVDRLVLRQGLDCLAACRSRGTAVELFLPQSFASAADEGWIERVRDEIAGRDLIHLRPTIQLRVSDTLRHLHLAAHRAAALSRLGIRLCLDGLVEGERGQYLLEAIPAAYVRLSGYASRRLPAPRLRALVAQASQRGAAVAARNLDGPDLVARLYSAGVDLVQGPFIQTPLETMSFDFTREEAVA